jgi:hypothetical protein
MVICTIPSVLPRPQDGGVGLLALTGPKILWQLGGTESGAGKVIGSINNPAGRPINEGLWQSDDRSAETSL